MTQRQLLTLVLICSFRVVTVSQEPSRPPFRDTGLRPEERAADLVSRLTLEEKAAQLKDVAIAIPRLGVPAYNWWNEGLHGVARAGEATVFPQAIGLAATWDEPLVHEVAGIVAREFRAKYVATLKPDGGSDRYRGLTVWSPNINIFRDPRWGRGQETFGEDPHLTTRLGVAFIQGLQGRDPQHPLTVAAVKHFAVHSGPEVDRHKEDVHPSAHDLEDTYLPAFRAAVIEGQAQGLMCSYNAIDGIPACASPLLQERVRGAWGFKGHIVSDCAAIADIFLETSHRYVRTPEEAVSAALKAGTDLFCREFGRDKSADPEIIVNAVTQGLLDVAVVDRALVRLFEARVRLGMFDPPGHGPHASISAADFDTPAHRAKSLEAARASLVLLKNNGLLPLASEPARIAVIGPNADSIDALNGNYNGTPSAPITVLSGIRRRFPRAEVTFVEGTGLVVPEKPADDDAIGRSAEAAVAAAAKADLVLFVGGLSPRLEGEEMKVTTPGFLAGDRTSIDLPAPQQQLLERVHATGKPVVLVLMNGGALGIDWADANLPAIVEAWYPGGEGGRAVAELIGGDFSPSGRLPVTFYRSAEQLPSLKDYAMTGRTYRYFGGQALFPFGHGLSYTRFSYGRIELSRRRISAGESTEVSVAVTNSGKRAGDEVVQLYLSQAAAGAPIRSLKGFRRIRLAPGETREVRFTLDARAMSVVDSTGRRAVVPGAIDLWVGGGQPLTSIQGSRDSLQVTNRVELEK